MYVNPDSVRTAYPAAWPQYPHDDPPRTPEQSLPRYSIFAEQDVRIPMRDSVRLAADVFRPWAPGEKFPALIAWSPYTRHLQRTNTPFGSNEAGLTEFWVPRGYAHVVVDVRGSNDSEGAWDFYGPTEQEDLFETIEWAAAQPWCNGKVGMVGCSYFGRSQILVAGRHRPPSLKAIFPYDAATDVYRDTCFHGGIPADGFMRVWLGELAYPNYMGGRLKDPSGFKRAIEIILGFKYPLDCEFYWERSAWPRLRDIDIPSYFGCDWEFYALHLRGVFSGWEGVGEIPKRMLVGPQGEPRRPFAIYHLEALRWYDHWLKEMDTGVMEGPPIQLYIRGENTWRGEREWPLARTEWRDYHLGGPPGGLEGTLLEAPGPGGERSYDYDPLSNESRYGNPRLIYRSAPMAQPMEVTGPVVINLVAQSSATDTDWFVQLMDEGPEGSVRVLTKGWLRASHRELDPELSRPWQPWHPHTREVPLTPNQPETFTIEIISTCNLFRPGHRVRLEIASCDSVAENFFWYHAAKSIKARNTILEGKEGSRLRLPVIPR